MMLSSRIRCDPLSYGEEIQERASQMAALEFSPAGQHSPQPRTPRDENGVLVTVGF